jgi:YHS domain-containing protein/thioredoxin-related protein
MLQRFYPTIRVNLAALLALSWLFLAASALRAADSGMIPWQQDLRLAREEARARNRPIWVQFTGPWCPFCERMERESFVHPRVVRLARESFIAVKLRSDLHESLSLQLGLSALPATIILKPSGEEIARHEGYLNAESFHAFLQGTLSRHGLLARTDPTQAKPPGSSTPLALAGYCPVSLVRDHRLVPGKESLIANHEGRVYCFASAEGRETFQRKPEQFIPVNGGRCPIAQVDGGEGRAGEVRWSVLYLGHLYLCASEESRQRFMKQPERYAHVDVADRGFCPHCWTREGLLVRGVPRYSLTRGGLRYFFPDPSHLEAFRNETDVSRR